MLQNGRQGLVIVVEGFQEVLHGIGFLFRLVTQHGEHRPCTFRAHAIQLAQIMRGDVCRELDSSDLSVTVVIGGHIGG